MAETTPGSPQSSSENNHVAAIQARLTALHQAADAGLISADEHARYKKALLDQLIRLEHVEPRVRLWQVVEGGAFLNKIGELSLLAAAVASTVVAICARVLMGSGHVLGILAVIAPLILGTVWATRIVPALPDTSLIAKILWALGGLFVLGWVGNLVHSWVGVGTTISVPDVCHLFPAYSVGGLESSTPSTTMGWPGLVACGVAGVVVGYHDAYGAQLFWIAIAVGLVSAHSIPVLKWYISKRRTT